MSYPDHLTLGAAILLAFFALLRSSELLALRWRDLARTSEGYEVLVHRSKVDPFRSGATIRVAPSGDPGLCAVTTLDTFLATERPRDGALFRFQTGSPLVRQRLNALVKDLASRAGVDSSRYSSHSFRIGAASTAAAAGVPEWKIQALGRWSSDCYKRCVASL